MFDRSGLKIAASLIYHNFPALRLQLLDRTRNGQCAFAAQFQPTSATE
jgi:hypothetical protein